MSEAPETAADAPVVRPAPYRTRLAAGTYDYPWPRHWKHRSGTAPQSGVSVTPPSYVRKLSGAAVVAVAWLLPWGKYAYPGYRRGFMELTGAGSWHTVRSWHRGDNRWPIAVLRRIEAHLAPRVAAGIDALQSLREFIAVREAEELARRGTGLVVVREDGKDRRGGWSRRGLSDVTLARESSRNP